MVSSRPNRPSKDASPEKSPQKWKKNKQSKKSKLSQAGKLQGASRVTSPREVNMGDFTHLKRNLSLRKLNKFSLNSLLWFKKHKKRKGKGRTVTANKPRDTPQSSRRLFQESERSPRQDSEKLNRFVRQASNFSQTLSPNYKSISPKHHRRLGSENFIEKYGLGFPPSSANSKNEEGFNSDDFTKFIESARIRKRNQDLDQNPQNELPPEDSSEQKPKKQANKRPFLRFDSFVEKGMNIPSSPEFVMLRTTSPPIPKRSKLASIKDMDTLVGLKMILNITKENEAIIDAFSKENPLPQSLRLKKSDRKFFQKRREENNHKIDNLIQSNIIRSYRDTVMQAVSPKRFGGNKSRCPKVIPKKKLPVALKLDDTRDDLKNFSKTFNKVIVQEQRAREGIVEQFTEKDQLFKFYPPSMIEKAVAEEDLDQKRYEIRLEILKSLMIEREDKESKKRLTKGAKKHIRKLGVMSRLWGFLSIADPENRMNTLQTNNIETLVQRLEEDRSLRNQFYKKMEEFVDTDRLTESEIKNKRGRLMKYDLIDDYDQELKDKEFQKPTKANMTERDPRVAKSARKAINSFLGLSYRMNQYKKFYQKQAFKMQQNQKLQESITAKNQLKEKDISKLKKALKSKDYLQVAEMLQNNPPLIHYKDNVIRSKQPLSSLFPSWHISNFSYFPLEFMNCFK